MKFFVDTANIYEIRKANRLGLIAGVTTNPSLIAKEERPMRDILRDILDIIDGSVSAEVVSEDVKSMIREGEDLASMHPNITVKVPLTINGLEVISHFAKAGIKTNVTLIFTPNQALLAARAGASYVSPFINRLEMIGHDGIELVGNVARLFSLHNIPTQIIAASIRTPYHVLKAAENGAHIGTMPYSVIEQLVHHPLTDQGIQKFNEDWNRLLLTTGESV